MGSREIESCNPSLAIPDLLPKCDMIPLKSLHETLNWKSVPCFGSNKIVNISLSL